MDFHRVRAKRSTRFPGMAGGTERDTEPVTLPRSEQTARDEGQAHECPAPTIPAEPRARPGRSKGDPYCRPPVVVRRPGLIAGAQYLAGAVCDLLDPRRPEFPHV